MKAPPCIQSRAGRSAPAGRRLVDPHRHRAVRPVDGEVAGGHVRGRAERRLHVLAHPSVELGVGHRRLRATGCRRAGGSGRRTRGGSPCAQPAAGTGNIDAREPVIQPTTWSRSVLGRGDVGDLLAAVEDDDPVGDLVAEREVVGDEHDRDALVGHPADQRLDVLGLLVAERGGRLVEQQDALRLAVDPDRAAGEGHDLALAAGEHLDRPGHRGGADAEPVELGLGAACASPCGRRSPASPSGPLRRISWPMLRLVEMSCGSTRARSW